MFADESPTLVLEQAAPLPRSSTAVAPLPLDPIAEASTSFSLYLNAISGLFEPTPRRDHRLR